uniref:Uncharacterized protein n=1 Tax=Panagrolaimus davidi TaxID=227884 RepID=A0A914PEN2_9BILA
MDGYNATASYKFLLIQNEGKNFVNVTDVNVSIPGVKILYSCVLVNTIQYSCFETLPNSTIFSSENSTISVMTVFKESVMDEEFIYLGGGIFDEDSLNDLTGREYTTESPCISYTGQIRK